MKVIKYQDILFKIIKNHPEYAISQCAQLLSRQGVVPGYIEYDGYGTPQVLFRHDNTYNYLDRLVWGAWVGGNLFKRRLKHADGDKRNCRLDNLYLSDKFGISYPDLVVVKDLNSEDVLERPNKLNRLSKKYKLAEYQIDEIVSLLASKELSQVDIAAEYGVSRKTISRIANKHTWKWKLS